MSAAYDTDPQSSVLGQPAKIYPLTDDGTPVGASNPLPVAITEPSGTFHGFAKTAGQTQTIPIGAFDGGVIILTGTGTVGGVDLPVGTPWNFASKLLAAVDVVCANPGTARIFYFT